MGIISNYIKYDNIKTIYIDKVLIHIQRTITILHKEQRYLKRLQIFLSGTDNKKLHELSLLLCLF